MPSGVKIQLSMSKIVYSTGKISWKFKADKLFFFFNKKKKRKFKNKVAVSTTKYQKSDFFSLQYIYNDLSKSTEILSVCSSCFYRSFPIQKYICNQRLFFTSKYVVF